MKILNKIVEFIESLISKARKLIHLEVSVTFEKPVEQVETTEKPVEQVETTEKPVEKPAEKTVETPAKVHETSEKKVETVEKPVKSAKRRGRPRKVKGE